jgi:spore germination protein YaaH
MKKATLLTLLVGLLATVTYAVLPPQIPLSPLGKIESGHSNPNHKTFVVLGFAPYWNLKKITADSIHAVTHYAYFAIHLRGNGEIYTKVNPREEDPGYTNYKRLLTQPPHKNLILTYMQENEEALVTMLNTPAARKAAIATIMQTTKDAGAVGVNIDLEPVGLVNQDLRNNFTLFIKELKEKSCPLTAVNCPLLTISVYPSAAARQRLWDLSQLAPLTDYFVVMTYDYTMPKSQRAGPNSPLRDFSGEFEHSIVKNIDEISRLVPPKKILLGIPLYGYEWDTLDDSRYSPATARGVTASLERIEEMLREQTLELVWDRNSLTPYGISTESSKISQIYFENDVSIRLKLDLVKSADLGGIALWALGYDQGVSWLWPTINTLNSTSP